MATVKYEIDLSGPLFKKDVRKTIRENMRQALMAEAVGGRDIARSLVPVGPAANGHLRDSIVAVNKSQTGTPWALTAVVKSTINLTMPGHIGYATYIETGIRKAREVKRFGHDQRGPTGTFKGYHMFRAARGAMSRATKLLRADYTKGLE